jgi:hypothetical protein
MKLFVKTWIFRLALAACAAMALGQGAYAGVVASLQYAETSLDGGLFQYDYTLHVEGDPIADAGYDAYDFALFFSPTVSLVRVFAPVDWNSIVGKDFVDLFSLSPGAAPTGTDVGPGQSLAGFRFLFDAQVGSLPFQVMLANPIDLFNPIIVDGRSVPEISERALPLPAPLALMVTGLVGLALAKRRTRSSCTAVERPRRQGS